MRKFFVAASVAVIGAGLFTPIAHAAPAAGINWTKCTSGPLKTANADCGFVEVPLDYAKPDGEKIQLAVSRVAHKVPDEQSQGPILVNPGGPGGSGLNLATLGKSVPNKVGEQYDWIGFDPRGVGSSKPALACDENITGYNRPRYTPGAKYNEHDEIVEANLKVAKAYAESCAKSPNARLIDHIKTVDNVKDMDEIRKALGAPQISYYGFSYGTYLGQVYSTLFGKNIKRMVIDGVVDNKDVWYQANLNQDIAFEKNINTWFGWIAKYNDTYKLGATQEDVSKNYYATQESLYQHPAEGKIGGSEFADVFLPAGYSQRGWDTLARAWSNWALNGDASGLLNQYAGPGDDNGFAIYLGTQCTDVQWPKDWTEWYQDNRQTAKKAPFYTWANNWFNAPCLYWPGKASTPVKINPKDAPPVLILSEEEDGATPYDGALRAREIFPNSVLISTPGGTTHSNSLRGNACVDNPIANYLATGELPKRTKGHWKSDAQCQAAPQPTPKPVSAQTAGNASKAAAVRG
ncbi:alpha/beta hydrolase [Pseudonocardiaceae bacterium YIM PH 21723]|nr:alpha/beta hydrolase [Pseudonocardiaceae bacterium YIM PH 21723]